MWRHGCLSLSRITGNMKLIENGKISVKKTSNDIKTSLEAIATKVFFFLSNLHGTGTFKLQTYSRQACSPLAVIIEILGQNLCQCMDQSLMLRFSAENYLTKKWLI